MANPPTPTDPARGERAPTRGEIVEAMKHSAESRERWAAHWLEEAWATADALVEVLRDIVDRELITPTLRHRIQAELTAYDEGSRDG